MDTNFGSSPFDTEHETNDQQENIVEYEPTSQPEIYRPPPPKVLKTVWGTPAKQPAVNDEEPEIIRKYFTEKENHKPIPEISRNPENSQENPSQHSLETPENNTEIDAQEAEEIVNTRREKYHLRPNPNPYYSGSCRH